VGWKEGRGVLETTGR